MDDREVERGGHQEGGFALRRAILCTAVLITFLAGREARADDDECLVCHGDRETMTDVWEEGNRPLERLLVDAARYQASVHADQGCTTCHDGYDFPHDEAAETYGCAVCHDDAAEAFAASVHADAVVEDGRAVDCAACHGIHDVLPVDDRHSPVHPFEVYRTCGKCHFEIDVATASTQELLESPYADDTHGHALMGSGLINAPSCVTCHHGHDIRRADDPEAAVHRDNVSETCGSCHVGIYERYSKSIHGTIGRGHPEDNRNGQEPATCTDCHVPHGIELTDQHFKLGIIETCSKCHGDRGYTYKGTYHGRVAEIGFGGVAACDACHTAHAILPTSDPRSSVHPDNRRETCAQCHTGATAAFAGYMVHADPRDKERFPVLFYAVWIMRWIIYVTWAMWGVHSVLWLYRSLKDRKRLQAHAQPATGRWYRRWPWSYRAIHLTLIFSFLLLALTGLPLRFADAAWSGTIFGMLGGAESVRYLHRVGAALTFAYATVFLVMIAVRFVRGERVFRGPTTLLPRKKDLDDIRANLRYFVKGGDPPRFDRWTYYEKFDFIAEVWGVLFIGLTGLVMWFPMFFTSFLPPWVINLSHILHSYEALLATSFIFTMHFFNANLRPGKFPVDTMFLHGRISEEELKHERPAEYARMEAEGRLETEAMPPPRARVVRRARVIGVTLLSIGLLLLLLMLSTLL